MEGRRAPRVRAQTPISVGFVSSNEKFVGSLLDFSPFGLSVRTAHEVKAGMILKLGIVSGAEVFRAAAIVRTSIPGGFGVEFLSMHPVDREALRRQYARLQLAARNSKKA